MNKYRQFLQVGVVAICLLVIAQTDSMAQRRYNTHFVPYSSVTFGGGTSTYFGDLAGYRQPFHSLVTLPRWNVGLGYTRQFTPKLAARAMFTWARITGDDYTYNKNRLEENLVQYARNLHFRNDVKEFAITGLYNFIEDGRSSDRRAKFTPYLFAGVALVAHSPEALTPYSETEGQHWVKLQPLRTEGQGQPGRDKPYSLVTVAIPMGIGARYKLNDNFNLGFEIGYRYTFTDYLDDVGPGTYPAPDTQQGLALQMSNRRFEALAARDKNHPNRYQVLVDMFNNGTAEQKAAIEDALTTQGRGGKGILPDGYLLTNFSIQYVIPTKIKCPPVK